MEIAHTTESKTVDLKHPQLELLEYQGKDTNPRHYSHLEEHQMVKDKAVGNKHNSQRKLRIQ